MILLVDIGNSRIKWAVFNQGLLKEQDSYKYNSEDKAEVIAEFIKNWSSLEKTPSRILISSVVDKTFTTILDREIWDAYQIEPEYLMSGKTFQKLKNGYTNPAMLGVDRWLSLVGAYALNNTDANNSAFCVIDCGTAITVDAVDSTGKHLGGFIIPGVKLMEQSLLENTKQIKPNMQETDAISKPRNPSGENSFLANNTKHAVVGGIYYAVVAYIENIVSDLVAILNSHSNVYITGGDADKIISILNSGNTTQGSKINYELNHSLIWQGMLNSI